MSVSPEPDTATPDPDALRDWGRRHPVVRHLLESLPERPRAEPFTDGLYVDAAHAPAITVAGEARVSIVRVLSSVKGVVRLVGQVQVTEEDAEASRRARTYVHQEDVGLTREVADADAWWLSVLDAHYARDGRPLPLVPDL